MVGPALSQAHTRNPLTTHLVPGLEYHENFIDQAEHAELLRGIDERGRNAWKQLTHRRLQNHGGLPHAKGMVPCPLPRYLERLAERLVESGVVSGEEKPNHALVNRYEPGEGIDAHEDGPVFMPYAAILSLQSQIVMDFYEKTATGNVVREPAASIVLHPCSLLCMRGAAYTGFLHGIAPREVDSTTPAFVNSFQGTVRRFVREQRTSITLRRSAKTLGFRL